MTFNRFFAPVLMAAGLATAPAMLPAAAQAQTSAQTVIVSDPARLQVTESIMTNLKLYEIMVHVGQKTLLESNDVASYSAAQKTQLTQAFADAMAKRRGSVIRKLAAGVRGDFSMEQLNNLNALSRIKYVQDLIAQGADPTLVADAGSMSTADQTFIQSIGNAPYVTDFFTKAIDYNVIKDDVIAATVDAYKVMGKTPGQ